MCLFPQVSTTVDDAHTTDVTERCSFVLARTSAPSSSEETENNRCCPGVASYTAGRSPGQSSAWLLLNEGGSCGALVLTPCPKDNVRRKSWKIPDYTNGDTRPTNHPVIPSSSTCAFNILAFGFCMLRAGRKRGELQCKWPRDSASPASASTQPGRSCPRPEAQSCLVHGRLRRSVIPGFKLPE